MEPLPCIVSGHARVLFPFLLIFLVVMCVVCINFDTSIKTVRLRISDDTYGSNRRTAGISFEDYNLGHALPPCSEELIQYNSRRLETDPSKCPSEPWYWEWQSDIRAENFVYVEIGCNKATDAVMNLRAYSANDKVDLHLFEGLTNFTLFSCRPETSRWNDIVTQIKQPRAKKYTHFCIEAAKENVDPVKRAAESLGLDRLGLRVHQIAISSSSKPPTAKFPKVRPGDEAFGLDTGGLGLTDEFYEVNVCSLDEFVLRHDIRQMDVLKIDTEGNDPLVILGAIKSLTFLRPAYLQFENHEVGRWATFNLKDIIDLLDGLSYECFWATEANDLIRITSCWADSYAKYKQWSNIACYDRRSYDLKARMDKYILQMP